MLMGPRRRGPWPAWPARYRYHIRRHAVERHELVVAVLPVLAASFLHEFADATVE